MLSINIGQAKTLPVLSIARDAALISAKLMEADLIDLPEYDRTIEMCYANGRLLVGGKPCPSVKIIIMDEMHHRFSVT